MLSPFLTSFTSVRADPIFPFHTPVTAWDKACLPGISRIVVLKI